MNTLTVRLPAALAAEIEAESCGPNLSKSDVVQELSVSPRRRRTRSLDVIADLVGTVGGLPVDLGGRRKAYLKATGYGRQRPR